MGRNVRYINDAFAAQIGVLASSVRHDLAAAGAGVFFQRQLEHILPTILEEPLPPMSGFDLFPVSGELPAGIETFVARHSSSAGRAKLIGTDGDDVPTVDFDLRETRHKVAHYAIGAKWTVHEMLSAMYAGTSIDGERLKIARDVAMRTMHDKLWLGDGQVGDDGLYGVFRHPLIPKSVLANGIDGVAADTVLATLNGMANAHAQRTKGRQTGKNLVMAMPLDDYAYIASTARSANSDTTILQYFLQNSPYVREVVGVYECSAEYHGQAAGRIVLFEQDAAKVRFMMSGAPTQLPPEARGFSVQVNMTMSTAGLWVPYPLEMTIGELPAA